MKTTIHQLMGAGRTCPGRSGFLSGLLLSWVGLAAAEPQSLDEVQFALLFNSCQQLWGSNAMEFFDNAGPRLYGICAPSPSGPPGGGVGGGAGSAGGGAAGAQTQFTALNKRLAKRRGDDKSPAGAAGDQAEMVVADGLNLFFAGQFEAIDRHNSRFETGYSGNAQGAAMGADWRANDWLLAGLALNYHHADNRFSNVGGFQVEAFGPAVYASLTPSDKAFVDIVLEYTHQWRARDRFSSFAQPEANKHLVSGLLSSAYGADRYGANLTAGYDLVFGPFSIGPRLGFRYSEMSINAYGETGATGLELNFLRDRISSLQSSIGLLASAAVGSEVGVFTPQISFDWTHEFQNNQRAIRASFVEDGRANPTVFTFNNDAPDRDFFHLGAGIGLTLPEGIQPYINFDALLGNRWFDQMVGTVGVRLAL